MCLVLMANPIINWSFFIFISIGLGTGTVLKVSIWHRYQKKKTIPNPSLFKLLFSLHSHFTAFHYELQCKFKIKKISIIVFNQNFESVFVISILILGSFINFLFTFFISYLFCIYLYTFILLNISFSYYLLGHQVKLNENETMN